MMMRRRDFIAGLGGSAVAWPLAAGAQQRPAMPVIGYLSARSSESDVAMLAAFRRGLNEAGYVEGRNLAIEYRFADGQYNRLLALGTDLIGRQVAVIVFAGAAGPEVSGGPFYEAWRLLRASNMPIVFNGVGNPVGSGLVSSY
jgi:putative tryptophan/tyrosine transport system substrate-binding protein